MIGEVYWTTGITLRYDGQGRWEASLKFYDDGFCDDESTEGNLTTRYFISLETAVDTLIADAAKLGIRLVRAIDSNPSLYAFGEGESEDWPMPDGWRELLAAQAERIGFHFPYRIAYAEQ